MCHYKVMMMMKNLLFLLFFVLNDNNADNYTALDNEMKLKEYLFSPDRYDPLVRPKRNHSEVLVIEVSWKFIKLTKVVEKRSMLSHVASTKFCWVDEYLSWDPENYGGLLQTYVRGKYIWIPKLKALNQLDGSFLDNIKDNVFRITSNGTVSFTPSGEVSFICDMNAEQFPYDCHTCSLLVTSDYFSADYISFSVSDGKTYGRSSFENSVWYVENPSQEILPGEENIFTFSITLKRKSLFYMLIIVVPSIFLSVVIIAIYFIPEDEGEKISSGMTVFLTFIVFLLQMSDSLPENSNALPMIGIYFMMLMVSSVVIIIDSVIMVNRPNRFNVRKDGKMTSENASFNNVMKTEKCNINLRTLFHYVCGVICFLLIVIAHVMLISRSMEANCK